jgi:hypothetical protein
MAAAGVNRSDEVRAGAVGLLVILAVWAVIETITYQVQKPAGGHAAMPTWLAMLTAAAPGGIVVALAEVRDKSAVWAVLASAGVSHALLAAWFIVRFGRVAPGRGEAALRQPAAKTERGWLAPPRASRLGAMIWKQVRESAPLAALGAGAIVAVTLAIAWLMRSQGDPMSPSNILGLAIGIWMMVGFGVSLVAGIGVFMEDLRPGVHGFWRSRPIDVNQWFAVKYFAGLLVTLVTLAVGAVALVLCVAAVHGREVWTSFSQGTDPPLALIGAGLLVQLGLFSAAVAAMTLIRQPVYAAVAAIAAAFGTVVSIGYVLEQLSLPPGRTAAIVIAGTCAALIAAAVAAAWLAVKNDWGWKA